jgi:hypothetical protein
MNSRAHTCTTHAHCLACVHALAGTYVVCNYAPRGNIRGTLPFDPASCGKSSCS